MRGKIEKNEIGGACGSYWERRGVYRLLVGKPEGKRPLGRSRRRWEVNIKMDIQELVGGCGDWMELGEDRDRWRAFVSTVMNLRVPKMRGISWLAAEPVSFSRRTLLHGVSKLVCSQIFLESPVYYYAHDFVFPGSKDGRDACMGTSVKESGHI